MLPLLAHSGHRASSERLSEPVLHWVLRGTARIVVDGREHWVAAGRALWVPRGTMVRVVVHRSDVLVPVPGLDLGSSARPSLVDIPLSWCPWLLQAFGEALGYLDGAVSHDLLQSLLHGAAPAQSIAAPRMPVSEQLHEVAVAISEHPAVPISELVRHRLAGWSPRTLQRQFLAETGMTPQQWARRQRLVVAADLLADGQDIAVVANTVGYATTSGFSRTFLKHFGMSPGRWCRQIAAEPVVCRPEDAPSPDTLPAQRTWTRVNGSHVAVWVARGEAVLTIGARELRVGLGGAVVLPAGVPNNIQVLKGSLVLPLGFRSGREGGIGEPLIPPQATPQEHDDLVQAMVAAYTGVRPYGFDPATGFDLVRTRSARRPASAAVEAISALASGLATGVVGAPTLSACARWLGLTERELRRIVNDGAGMTFSQWVRISRMSRARAQLHGGEPASAVSRGLGYAHLPAFSRAFREVHGMSPRRVSTTRGHAGEPARWHHEIMIRSERRTG